MSDLMKLGRRIGLICPIKNALYSDFPLIRDAKCKWIAVTRKTIYRNKIWDWRGLSTTLRWLWVYWSVPQSLKLYEIYECNLSKIVQVPLKWTRRKNCDWCNALWVFISLFRKWNIFFFKLILWLQFSSKIVETFFTW